MLWLQAIFNSNPLLIGCGFDQLWLSLVGLFGKPVVILCLIGCQSIPTKFVLTISNMVGLFMDAVRAPEDNGSWGSVEISQVSRQVPRWNPHSFPYTKINVDASWFKMSMSGFVGVVFRDAKGRFIAAA